MYICLRYLLRALEQTPPPLLLPSNAFKHHRHQARQKKLKQLHNSNAKRHNSTLSPRTPNRLQTTLPTFKMPATRRARGASKTAQRTLGFTHSKSTKPLPSSKDLSPTPTPSPAVVDVGHVSSEAAVAQQAAVEVTRVRESRDRSVEELQAKQVTDAQIRRYWREREAERIAPRVHQQDLSVEEKILRLFDMSSQYGVCSVLLLVSLVRPFFFLFLPAVHVCVWKLELC